MALIDQNVPESQKTKEWIISIGRHILATTSGVGHEWEKDNLCWDLYNGRFEESDLDYLRKVGEYEYPAKVRFFPVIRPYLDNLSSEHSLRPFNFVVYAFDNKSVERKINTKSSFFLDNIINTVFDYQGKIKQAQETAQGILQQIEQATNPEVQAQNQAQGIQPAGPAPQIVIAQESKQEFEKMLYLLNQKYILTEKQIQDIEIRYKMNERETHEIIAQRALEYLQFNAKLDRVFQNGFLSKTITDKAIYYVDWDGKKPDPEVRKVNEKHFYYSDDNAIDFVHQSEWCQEDQFMSVSNVLDQWRFELSTDDIEYLNNKRAMLGFTESEIVRSYGTISNTTAGVLSPMNSSMSTCKVSRIFFKSSRATNWKKTPNKYLPDVPRTLLVDETDIPPADKRKKEETFENFYLNDIYEIVFIDGRIPVRARKKPVQNRSLDFFGEVPLPYSGIAWKSMNRIANSPVYRAKDIQILYNIVHYHKELWLALSGAKGLIMDLSQKPEGMSMAEWQYQRKMGTGWIQTMRKGRNPSFNQFKTYDDSLGQGYNLLLETLDHLERLCGKVIGMPPQRLGEIRPTDQVGTTDHALNQSNMTTEILFKEHEVVKGLVYEQLVNLVRVAWKKGKRGSYILGNEQVLLDIPSQILADQQYRLFIKSSGKEYRSVQQLQSVVSSAVAAGKMPIFGLAKLMRLENLTEFEKTLEVMEEKSNQLQQKMIELENSSKGQADQNTLAMKAQLEKDILAMKQQLDAKIAEGEIQIKNLNTQIQSEALAWQKQKESLELQLKQGDQQVKAAGIDAKTQTDAAKIESTRQTELAYLEEQRREFDLKLKQDDDMLQHEKKLKTQKNQADIDIKHMKAQLDMAIKKRESSNRSVDNEP